VFARRAAPRANPEVTKILPRTAGLEALRNSGTRLLESPRRSLLWLRSLQASRFFGDRRNAPESEKADIAHSAS
jgi:hypothetical protein